MPNYYMYILKCLFEHAYIDIDKEKDMQFAISQQLSRCQGPSSSTSTDSRWISGKGPDLLFGKNKTLWFIAVYYS